MSATGMLGREFDFEKFRLRKFVDRLIDLDEVEISPDPTPLTALRFCMILCPTMSPCFELARMQTVLFRCLALLFEYCLLTI